MEYEVWINGGTELDSNYSTRKAAEARADELANQKVYAGVREVNPLGRYFCRKCASEHGSESVPANERYSMGIYAGMYCDACWDKDGRNHDRPFDPLDAGESYEDDY